MPRVPADAPLDAAPRADPAADWDQAPVPWSDAAPAGEPGDIVELPALGLSVVKPAPTATRAMVALRDAISFRAYCAGLSIRETAEMLNAAQLLPRRVTRAQVQRGIDRVLGERSADLRQGASEARAREVAALDQVVAAWYARGTAGQDTYAAAILLRALSMRAELTGAKQEQATPDGRDQLRTMSTEEMAQRIAALSAGRRALQARQQARASGPAPEEPA